MFPKHDNYANKTINFFLNYKKLLNFEKYDIEYIKYIL